MKQKSILFSALLIISLLAGAASAEEIENTDNVLVSGTDLTVSISYSENGPFKMGDVVEITATFNKPVIDAVAIVENSVLTPTPCNMTCLSDTVWCYDYIVPGDINDAVDVTIYGYSLTEEVEKTDTDAFVIDNEAPRFKRISPSSDAVNTDCVVFEFGAFDKLDNTLKYEITIYDVEKKTETACETGTISTSSNEIFEIELSDGYYQWKVNLVDDAGNIGSSGIIDLYVDTCSPEAHLVYPEDQAYFDPMNPLLSFVFTTNDAFSAKYNLELDYQLYVDGEPVDIIGSGKMFSGDYIEIPYVNVSDGAHNWSVSFEDKAGNCVNSAVRKFYVNYLGLQVFLVSPDGGYVSECPEFNFSVAGGAGLPFDYELYIDNEKVKSGTCTVGEDPLNFYSISATVEDAENLPWTVIITDCAGNVYPPIPDSLYFSVDTESPEAVENLCVTDAIGNTEWYYTYDEPGLYVCWDKNTEEDLASTPYMIFISDCEPSCIEDMEVAVPISAIYEGDTFMYMYIGEYCGEPLVYGKDYWVAVIALDRAGNYDDCFALCGPVQTYEDMAITLNAGWNLKSVPKNLATFNNDPESVFGECSTVIYWDGCNWEFPTVIEPCKGYWVFTAEADATNIKFKPMPSDSTNPDVPPSLELAAGWQMIGHTSTLPAEWSTTLASLKGLLIDYKYSNLITYSQGEGWGGIIPDTGLINLVTEDATTLDGIGGPVTVLQDDGLMVPGQGYWIFMREDGTYASIESSYSYQNV